MSTLCWAQALYMSQKSCGLGEPRERKPSSHTEQPPATHQQLSRSLDPSEDDRSHQATLPSPGFVLPLVIDYGVGRGRGAGGGGFQLSFSAHPGPEVLLAQTLGSLGKRSLCSPKPIPMIMGL